MPVAGAIPSIRRSGDEGFPGFHGSFRRHLLDVCPVHPGRVDETVGEPRGHRFVHRLTRRGDPAGRSAEHVDDVRECLCLRRGRQLLDALAHLGVDLTVRSSSCCPDLGDLDRHPPSLFGRHSPHDSPVPIADGQLAETDQRSEKRFTCSRIALEEDHLLERLACNLRVQAHKPAEIIDGGSREPHVGTRLVACAHWRPW
jgi:hypothetical protein